MNTLNNGTITAYPLSWPLGWKRTLPQQRQRARFNRKDTNTRTWADGSAHSYTMSKELSVADAISRVLDELRGFGVDRADVVISTNLDVRLDGLPRSGQRAPADPGAAVYWMNESGAPRCMAIDQYDRVADNLAAIAATLGAMRAIERHGGAEVLDRVFQGFAALPAPAGGNWWEVLSTSSTASADEIKAAFRNLARQHHPDSGGDAEKFIQVQQAYDAGLKAVGV